MPQRDLPPAEGSPRRDGHAPGDRTVAADLADARLLGDLAARLVTEENHDTFFQEILSAAITLTGADAGTVQVYDPATQELVLLVARGFEPHMTERFRRVGAGSATACGLALRAGMRMFADFDDDDSDETLRLHAEAGYHAAQATPLVARRGAPIGMLNTHWRTPGHRPAARQLRFLDLLARQTADLIEQRQIHESLRASEQQLRVMAENLPGGAVFIVDAELRYQLAAGEAFLAAGFTPGDFLGRTVREAVGPELATIYEPYYRAALRGDSFETTHQAHGRDFQTRGIPLRDAHGAVTSVLAVSFDITERLRAEDALAAAQRVLEDRVRQRTAEVQALVQRVISAQEEERRRIARNIHDHLGQQMTALRMHLEAWQARTGDDPAVREHAARTRELAGALDQSIDFLTSELRPSTLDHLGLAAALRNLVSGWSERFGIPAECDVLGLEGPLPPAVETNVYRLVQEALHNVMKHAAASRVSVIATRVEDELVLMVEDDGRGFALSDVAPLQRVGLGLVSMRERAALMGGRLDIETQPGAGTALFVTIPLEPETPDA